MVLKQQHRSLNLCNGQEGDVDSNPEGQRNLEELNKFSQLDFAPFDPRTKRTEAKLRGPDGSIFRTSKVGWLVF